MLIMSPINGLMLCITCLLFDGQQISGQVFQTGKSSLFTYPAYLAPTEPLQRPMNVITEPAQTSSIDELSRRFEELVKGINLAKNRKTSPSMTDIHTFGQNAITHGATPQQSPLKEIFSGTSPGLLNDVMTLHQIPGSSGSHISSRVAELVKRWKLLESQRKPAEQHTDPKNIINERQNALKLLESMRGVGPAQSMIRQERKVGNINHQRSPTINGFTSSILGNEQSLSAKNLQNNPELLKLLMGLNGRNTAGTKTVQSSADSAVVNTGSSSGMITNSEMNPDTYLLNTATHQTPSNAVKLDTKQTLPNKVCFTPGCVKAAGAILDSVDDTVNPCDDFYKYTCGKWLDNNVLDPNQEIYGSFGELDAKLKIQIKALLEKPVTKEDMLAYKKAKDTYSACMNEDLIETSGIHVAQPMILHLGGWPGAGIHVNNPNPRADVLQRLLETAFQYSTSTPMMEWFVLQDPNNKMNNIMYIDQPTLRLPKAYYLNPPATESNPFLQAYIDYATKLAMLFQTTKDPETARRDMREVVELEKMIANITLSSNERQNPSNTYNRTTIGELKKQLNGKFTQLNWLSLLQSIVNRNGINVPLTDNTPVINRNHNYFVKMFDLLDVKYGANQQLKERVLQNYFTFHVLSATTGSLSKDVRSLAEDFLLGAFGVQPRPRWQTCVSVTNNRLPEAVGRMYVDKHFNSDAKSKIRGMLAAIGLSTKKAIRDSRWMDITTKQIALEKADSIHLRLAYPDYIMNNTSLNSGVQMMDVQRDRYFDNTVAAMSHGVYENAKKLLEPVNKDKWDFKVAEVNAVYNPALNQILFPAGILQDPFFNADRPSYLNYAAIGWIISHEMTHGFDKSGKQFDKNGKLNDWWTLETARNFDAKSECMVNQYSRYNVKEAKANQDGKLTLNENIADNGGLKIAHNAWKMQRGFNQEPALPGLQKYNDEQLFFISAAQVWCGIVSPKESARRIAIDTHAHFRYRVIGSMQNNEDFVKAFKCPNTSYMNAAMKCDVW